MGIIEKYKEHAMITVEYVIGLAIGLLVTFSILPTVLNTFNATTTTSWDSTTRTIWGLFPVIIIVVVLMAIYGKKRGH